MAKWEADLSLAGNKAKLTLEEDTTDADELPESGAGVTKDDFRTLLAMFGHMLMSILADKDRRLIFFEIARTKFGPAAKLMKYVSTLKIPNHGDERGPKN